jgi:putative colanic acid biosynthesis acetyltransferase WcaF
MNLVTEPVTIEDGAWLTARCVVLPGARIRRNAIVTPGSTVRGELQKDTVYGGNPAQALKPRFAGSLGVGEER